MNSGSVRLAGHWDGPDGAPVLVLGNSLGTTGDLWARQVPVLARRFRVLRYEHRGHGGSPAPAGPYSVGELGRDVLALLDAAGVESACYAGVSLGGMVGMWLAAHAPERISALGLLCTSAHLPPAEFWLDRAAKVRAGGMSAIAEAVVARWFTPAFTRAEPAAAAAFIAMVRGVDPEGYAGCCEAIAAMDLRPALGAIAAPTLVIAGSDDPATPPWHAAVIARAIPGATLRVIRGAAHLPTVSQPAEVAAALLARMASAGAQ